MEKYVIYSHIGELSKPNNGWVKELNLISWNDREPVYDIRTWNASHTIYGKGITMTPKQMEALKELLSKFNKFS